MPVSYETYDFRNSYLYKLRHLADSFYAVLDQRARLATGISLSQGVLLSAIAQQQPISQQQIAAVLDITPGAVSRQVDVAIQKSWLKVGQDKRDQRKQLLEVTPEGEQVIKDMYSILQELADHILGTTGNKLDFAEHIELLQQNIDSIHHN